MRALSERGASWALCQLLALLCLAMALLSLAGPARAMPTGCALLQAQLLAAKGGEVLVLGGDCPAVNGRAGLVIRQRYQPPVTIEATGRRIDGVVISGGGLRLQGGTWAAPAGDASGPPGYAVHLMPGAANVLLELGTVVDARRGVLIDRASDVVVRGLVLREMTVDGINVANSQRVRIEGNVCISWSTGEAHPDCYQGWTRAGYGMSDVQVIGNVAIGKVQGIFFGNHLTRVPPDPGFDRVTIRDNLVRNTYPQGVALSDCRGCEVTGNDVARLPGARFRSSINVGRSSGRICGNRAAEADLRRVELLPCP